MIKRLKAWWNRRRRSRALRRINKLRWVAEPLGEIRQFIYMDSIALRSLYISRYGPEDARLTITNSRTTESELGAKVSSPESFGLSTNIGASRRKENSESRQIERVSSDQALFRDFIEREKFASHHSQIWDGTCDTGGDSEILPFTPKRGKLIQIRIKLEADRIFRLSSFASALSAFMDEIPEMNQSGSSQILQISNVLRQLLIDQAPIDSELVDWAWDAHKGTLARPSESTVPLRLVALTQLDNYWLDVRRALFDGASCTALVRVAQDDPKDSWSPLKMFDAMRDIPGIADIDESLNEIMDGLSVISESPESSSDPADFGIILMDYAESVSSVKIPPLIEKQVKCIAIGIPSDQLVTEVMTHTFDEVDSLIKFAGFEIAEPNSIGTARSIAIEKFQNHATKESQVAVRQRTTRNDKNFIIGEVIAIYW